MAKARKPNTTKRSTSKNAAVDAKTDLIDAIDATAEDAPKNMPDDSIAIVAEDVTDEPVAATNKDTMATKEIDVSEVEGRPDPSTDGMIEPQTPSVIPPPAQRNPFWPLVLGGAVAAALGFVVGRGDLFGADAPGVEQTQPADLTELHGAVDKLTGQIADQNTRMTALEGAGNSGLSADFTATFEGLETTLSDLQNRLTDVEERPVTSTESSVSSADLTALQRSIEAQKAEVEGILATAQTVEEETREVAQQTLARAALTRVIAALDSGKPFAAALADLKENSSADVPENLNALASSGVSTLAMLQGQFPVAARAALAASRDDQGSEQTGGVVEFLNRQLGARSVAPREGSGPDAVLSRSEAAVTEGRMTDALAEIATLPETGQAAMSDWLADATEYQNAQIAAETLAQSLSTN